MRGGNGREKTKKQKKERCKIKGVDKLYESKGKIMENQEDISKIKGGRKRKEKKKKKELDKNKQTTIIKTTYFKSMPMFLRSISQFKATFVDTKPLPSTFVTKMVAPYSTNITFSS